VVLDRILTWFINAWTFLTVIVIIMGFGGMMLKAPTTWDGIVMIWDSLTGYRFYLTIMLLFSPALAAMWWKEKRQSRRG
jgi:hypothetical protein